MADQNPTTDKTELRATLRRHAGKAVRDYLRAWEISPDAEAQLIRTTNHALDRLVYTIRNAND